MSYNDMLTDFTNILDRDDCSNALAQTFLDQGMSRIQRACRLPSMERAQLITPTGAPMRQWMVPQDLIQVIDVIVPELNATGGQQRPLKKVAYRQLVRYDSNDLPRVFARSQATFYVAGSVPVGTTLQFIYYGNFSPFPTPDSENELSASTPDFAVYAALSYAGDYFEHPLTAQWEARFQSIKAEVDQMAMDLENEGGIQVVEPMYQVQDYSW
jgi:hypothetical protein